MNLQRSAQPMSGGWRLGELGGVEIRIDFSLLLITFFVAFTLATQVFPRSVIGISPVGGWLAGGIGSLLLVVSILWHEMAHVLTAQYYKLPVSRVVLNILGGQAHLSREPERAEHEFLIAAAGPLSSLLLAVFFRFLSFLPGLAGLTCDWLSTVNLTLAIFNMLPGFPLDGGRVLRAAVWGYTGSYRRATQIASRAGQVVAALIVLVALWMFTTRGAFLSAVLIGFMGLYLYRLSYVNYLLAGGGKPVISPSKMSVRRVMRFNVPILEPNLPLAMFVWRYLDFARDQAFPVMVNGSLVGMISLSEIVPIDRLEWGRVKVGDRMIPRAKLVLLGPEQDLQSALAALDRADLNHAPVYEGDSFVGMLNRRDIVYRT